tara:strand:- start:512 stop:922 length:411 start_codon:yes stop_codon:yes gene_type:complete
MSKRCGPRQTYHCKNKGKPNCPNICPQFWLWNNELSCSWCLPKDHQGKSISVGDWEKFLNSQKKKNRHDYKYGAPQRIPRNVLDLDSHTKFFQSKSANDSKNKKKERHHYQYGAPQRLPRNVLDPESHTKLLFSKR